MSRNQWIVLTVLGLGVAVVCGCLGAMVLFYLAGGYPAQTAAPVEPADTPAPRGTSTPTTPRVSALCQAGTQDYLGQIHPLLEEWDDAVEVADSTARIALSPIVRDLQGIKRDVEDVAVPDCARHGSGLLIDGMDSVIDSFIAFMSEESDSVVSRYFSEGCEGMTMGLQELTALAEGRIPGTPTATRTRVPPAPTATHVVSVAAPTNTRVIPVSTPLPPTPTRFAPSPTPGFLPAGSAMTVNNWEVRADRIVTADAMTAPYSGEVFKASGRWALIFMAVTNRGLRPDTFVAVGQFQVLDANGTRSDEDPVVSFIAQDLHGTDLAVDVNPDASAYVVAAYDISRESAWYALVPGILADTHTTPVLLQVP
jgi:hypothetical protein